MFYYSVVFINEEGVTINSPFATKNIKPSLNLQKPPRQPTAATPPLDGNYKRFFDLLAKHQLLIINY